MPTANYPIMKGRSIRTLDTLNIKIRLLFLIILTEQDVARYLIPISATNEALAPLTNAPIILPLLVAPLEG